MLDELGRLLSQIEKDEDALGDPRWLAACPLLPHNTLAGSCMPSSLHVYHAVTQATVSTSTSQGERRSSQLTPAPVAAKLIEGLAEPLPKRLFVLLSR